MILALTLCTHRLALTGRAFFCSPSPETTSRMRHKGCAAVDAASASPGPGVPVSAPMKAKSGGAVDAAMANPGPGAPVLRKRCAAVAMPNPGRVGIVKVIRVPGLPPVPRNRSLFIDRAMCHHRRPRWRPRYHPRRRIRHQAARGHDGGSQRNSDLLHHYACSHSVHPGRPSTNQLSASESQLCGIVAERGEQLPLLSCRPILAVWPRSLNGRS
jgi:hypothetical protein